MTSPGGEPGGHNPFAGRAIAGDNFRFDVRVHGLEFLHPGGEAGVASDGYLGDAVVGGDGRGGTLGVWVILTRTSALVLPAVMSRLLRPLVPPPDQQGLLVIRQVPPSQLVLVDPVGGGVPVSNRRNLQPFQRAELALVMEPIIAKRAKENVLAAQESSPKRNGKASQKSAEPIDTRQELARAAGVSHDTIHKVKAIAAKAPDVTTLRALVSVSCE